MADRDPLAWALRTGVRCMVRSGLRGVWVRGPRPAGAHVYAANHHSWWDPFVADTVLAAAGLRTAVLMDQANLGGFAFLRRLGVVGSAEPRAGLALLHAGRPLVLYPEGALRPAGPPHPLAEGAAWFAHRAGVPLWAAATRVVLRGQQWPEAYVTAAPVATGGSRREVTGRLARTLGAGLAALDRLVADTDPRAPLPGFRRVAAGRRGWDERLAARGGRP